MITPLDDRPSVITVVVGDAITAAPVVSPESETDIGIADDGTNIGAPVVKSDLTNEDCPGSRTGEGCE